jgi:polyferredoxin
MTTIRAQENQSAKTAATTARQERKARTARALKIRSIKQLTMGLSFIGLLITGWIYPLIGYFIPVCMVLGIGTAALQGRSWCNWLCPRGSFEDSLLQRISLQRRIPDIFRKNPMRIGVMAILMTVLTVQIIRLWPDPWAIGGFFVIMLSVTTGLGLILGIIFQQRNWCYICPIGTMSNWVGKNRKPLVLEEAKCLECNLCARKCPMQLSPVSLKEPAGMANRGDCLKCSICVDNCPTAALSWESQKMAKAA